jgi:ribosomal protein L13E
MLDLANFLFIIVILYDYMKVKINKPPIIKRQIRRTKLVRNGRGFSKSELKEVGIVNIRMAKNKGIPIDLLRKTTIADNVEQLKPIAKDILNLRKTAEIEARKKIKE